MIDAKQVIHNENRTVYLMIFNWNRMCFYIFMVFGVKAANTTHRMSHSIEEIGVSSAQIASRLKTMRL